MFVSRKGGDAKRGKTAISAREGGAERERDPTHGDERAECDDAGGFIAALLHDLLSILLARVREGRAFDGLNLESVRAAFKAETVRSHRNVFDVNGLKSR